MPPVKTKDRSEPAQRKRLERAWAQPEGWHYFSDINNSVVGIWYIVAAFGFMLFGGALALIIRLQLAVPDNDLVSSHNQE